VRDGGNGMLVEPGDGPALTAALIALLDHPHTRREYGQAGRKLVMNEFPSPVWSMETIACTGSAWGSLTCPDSHRVKPWR